MKKVAGSKVEEPYYQDPGSTLLQGDALKELSKLPEESVQMVMISPLSANLITAVWSGLLLPTRCGSGTEELANGVIDRKASGSLDFIFTTG